MKLKTMIKLTNLQRILFTVVILTGLIFVGSSHAQSVIAPKPLSTSFLLEFAQKLFDRGEYDEAQSLLKRILKSDPENPPVRRLLKSVEDQLNSRSAVSFKESRPSDIASDIIFIQKNVLNFERRNRDLEFAIRKTLQENMFLYQTLSRRNQDLMALRKKFLGYETDGSLSGPSASVEKTSEVLNTYQEEITQRDRELTKRNQEIALMMKEVGKSGTVFNNQQEIPEQMDSSVNALEWKNDLVEKRSYLVEKAITLYEKNKDLSLLNDELTAVSQSLKEANSNYGQTVSEYELKIQKLNSVWVQDKARQQVEIDQLRSQIKNEKVKLMASRLDRAVDTAEDQMSADLQSSSGKAASLSSKAAKVQPSATRRQEKKVQNDQQTEIEDGTLKQKDASAILPDPQSQIKRLEAELARKEQELNERSLMFDAKIRELKSGWAKEKDLLQEVVAERRWKTDYELAADDPLKGTDTYRNLIQELDYLKDQLSMREKEVYKFQKEMLGRTDEVELLQKKLNQRDRLVADMDALIVAKDQQIAALKKEIVAKIAQVKVKDAEIEALKARNISLEGVKDLNKRTVDIEKPLRPETGSSVDKLKGLVSELEGSLSVGSVSTSQTQDLKEQLGEALKTLQEKDRDIQFLRKQLESDNRMAEGVSSGDKKSESSRINEYRDTINDLKERLSVAVAQRREAENELKSATQKLSDMVNAERRTQDKSEDKAAAKRLKDLTQRLADLTSQLDQQADDFESQVNDLKDQLARKDSQISDLKDRLELKEKQVEQFYSTLEQATQKLNTKSTDRSQKPTPSVLSEIKPKPQVELKAQEEWDPADNDVYALQQRLNTLSKELRFTQDELVERTKEKGELQNQLKQKELESVKPLSEKDIVSLEKELAVFRQQSDLTRTTIRLQQESLEKSQKEVDRKERSLKSILDQSERLRDQIEDYRATVKEKDEQIALQQKALDHEIKKNDTLTKKLREIQKTAVYDQERDAGKSQSMADLKRELETYEIRESDYKRQINDIKEQLKTSYVMIEDGEKRVAVLKKRLFIREARIAELQKELDRIKEDYKKAAETQAAERIK